MNVTADVLLIYNDRQRNRIQFDRRRKISTRRRPHEAQFASLDARIHDFRLVPPSAPPSPTRVPTGHSRVECARVRIQAIIRAIALPSCRNGAQRKLGWPVVFRTGISQGMLFGLPLLRSSRPIGCPTQQIPAIPTRPTKPTPATSLVKALSRRPVIVERSSAVSRFDKLERPRLVSILGTTILLKASSPMSIEDGPWRSALNGSTSTFDFGAVYLNKADHSPSYRHANKKGTICQIRSTMSISPPMGVSSFITETRPRVHRSLRFERPKN